MTTTRQQAHRPRWHGRYSGYSRGARPARTAPPLLVLPTRRRPGALTRLPLKEGNPQNATQKRGSNPPPPCPSAATRNKSRTPDGLLTVQGNKGPPPADVTTCPPAGTPALIFYDTETIAASNTEDTSPQLVENGLRMLLQLITSWKNGEPSSNTITGAGVKQEALAAVVRGAEALGLVMLCQCKPYPRRLAVHVLRETKCLLEKLQLTGDEPALIDAADEHVPQLAERCLPLLPPAEKQAVLAVSQPDLVWVAERSHAVWTASTQHDETSTKNSWSGSASNGADPWKVILFGLLERSRVPARCPSTILQAWPILHARIHALFTIIEPAPVNDNRASLLSRGPTLPRKPEKERDGYMQVWKYYMTMAYLVVPAVPSPVIRCASPDLSLSGTEQEGWLGGGALGSSSESLNAGGFFTLPLSYARAHRHKRTRWITPNMHDDYDASIWALSSSSPDSLSERSGGEARGAAASPSSLHKLAVPLARCEVPEVRDAAIAACGNINPDALKDLMEELVPLLREAVDRKQENMRRRRRRDALRLNLNKMLLLIAQKKTFATSPFALEGGSLHPSLTEYLDGVRQSLEVEAEKDAPAAREQRLTNLIQELFWYGKKN
ncbi:unnamed protein product [Diatraea saccharalis]|uniref:Uncharacterized protein n=1 Tax=Diatraea saccharalis TaxID=40085 RepID=A0A9N9WHM6_9NEOP|nr:unnamed protein product [Diatraea saccharalis]